MMETETTEENSACPQADGMSLREMWVDLEDGMQMSDRLRLSQRQSQHQSQSQMEEANHHVIKSNGVEDKYSGNSRRLLFGLFYGIR